MNLKDAQVFVVALMISLLFFSCQKDDVIVQSLYDLSGAPLKNDDSKATRFLNVAAISIVSSKRKTENLEKITQSIRKITIDEPEVELVLFGETILGWYIDDDNPVAYQLTISEPVPGPATDIISQLADSLNIYVAFGMTESDNGQLYNSQVLINPSGEIEAVHRKVNLTPEDLASGFTAGRKTQANVTVVHINNIRVAMIVFADVNGYWLTEQLTEQKVELILHSMASEVPEFAIDPVSRQFNAWEVFANRFGTEGDRQYSGTTFIADPSGTVRVSGGEKETIKTYKIGVR
jgi:(R)-amidase